MLPKSLNSLSLHCPYCKNDGALRHDPHELVCMMCSAAFKKLSNGGVTFINIDKSVVADGVDKLKSRVKRYPKIYNVLIDILSPVYPKPTFERKRFLREASRKGQTVLNLGSGSSDFGPEVWNFDILPYGSVDVVCSIDNIPLADSSVDAIVNIAVLEHVSNPDDVVKEFLRVLKPGGYMYCFVPFIQGFHASPWDFQRYTKKGFELRFKEFDIEWVHAVGPTSGMLWVFQEWIALLLSFGSKRLHTAIWILMVLLTWPLKYIDVVLGLHPKSENIASGFSVLARKPR